MKIRGQQPGANRARFTLRRADGRAWTIILQALPYGFPEKNEREIPAPIPPSEFARGSDGKILRDEDGLAVRQVRREDPNYRAEVNRVNQLRTIAALVAALAADPEVQFESKRKDFPSIRAWAEAVEKEIAAAGITDAEILQMLGRVQDLSRGISDRVDQAADDFLPGAPPGQPGESPTAQGEPNST